MAVHVEFKGICTHVTLPTMHRVVLVHGEDGAVINGRKVPPHTPTLTIDPEDILGIDGWLYGLDATPTPGVWKLSGVRLELDGASDARLASAPDYSEVPRLSALTPDAPPLNDDVVQHGQAACYFDITQGRLAAVKNLFGAVSTVLTVATTDSPRLRVTSFWNERPRLISLRDGAFIRVEHIGSGFGETESDFLLHYRILKAIPADAGVPKEQKPKSHRKFDISSGCSNSSYP
jgi:hypothetical protein